MDFYRHCGRLESEHMPFSPQFLLNGLTTGIYGCILLRLDEHRHSYSLGLEGAFFARRIVVAHLLLVQFNGPDAHRIGKLTAVGREDDTLDFVAFKEKLKWRDIRLV
jgi:hypothetical protein